MKHSIVRFIAGVALVGVVLTGSMFASAAFADGYGDDRAKIENLQARYMFAMDWRDADAYAACFTEDGVLDYAGGVEKGREAIKKFVDTMRQRDAEQLAKTQPGKRPWRMRHNITNLVLTIDGDKAIGRAYWFEVENKKEDRHAEIGSYGHYEDELVKIKGEWLFTKRTIFNEQLDRRAAPVQSQGKSPAR